MPLYTLEFEKRTEEICEALDIKPHYLYVRQKNPSNNLPYHNWYHTMCMVQNCFEAGTYHDLPTSSMRALCVSALFHDFNHSGGKLDDSRNIINALLAFKTFQSQSTHYDNDLRHVQKIIEVTEYPYVREPFTIEQRIIRDADLMQVAYEDTWYDMIITGLKKEMSIKQGRIITDNEMLAGQIEFLKNIHLFTIWGNKKLHNGCLGRRFKEMTDKLHSLTT